MTVICDRLRPFSRSSSPVITTNAALNLSGNIAISPVANVFTDSIKVWSAAIFFVLSAGSGKSGPAFLPFNSANEPFFKTCKLNENALAAIASTKWHLSTITPVTRWNSNTA